MKYILWTVISILLIYAGYRTYRYMTLADGLSTKIANGAIILDVRTEREYDMGHIEGSINISLGTIRDRYTELDPARTYITVCSHGLRSVKAESLLKERGFKNVFNGGAWSDLKVTLKEQQKR